MEILCVRLRIQEGQRRVWGERGNPSRATSGSLLIHSIFRWRSCVRSGKLSSNK